MVDEQNLLEYIKSSKFLDTSIKSKLIEHFDKLNSEQILWLIEYFNNLKHDILKVLIQLKDINVCSFEEVKMNIDNTIRVKLKTIEFLEHENEQTEILNLLNSIE